MKRVALVCLVAMLTALGCATVIKQVDFSWSFESVVTADADGFVSAEPKTIGFNATELFRAETGEQATAAGKEVRIIRSVDGFYFLTSPGFRHVYIFEGTEGNLVLEKKVLIDENGMEKPIFNRRDLGIELVANGQVYLLDKEGIISGGKK